MEITQLVNTDILNINLAPELVIAVLIGIIILKGVALWKAARLKEKGWFWGILLLNTVGIVPGVYLYLRRNKKV